MKILLIYIILFPLISLSKVTMDSVHLPLSGSSTVIDVERIQTDCFKNQLVNMISTAFLNPDKSLIRSKLTCSAVDNGTTGVYCELREFILANEVQKVSILKFSALVNKNFRIKVETFNNSLEQTKTKSYEFIFPEKEKVPTFKYNTVQSESSISPLGEMIEGNDTVESIDVFGTKRSGIYLINKETNLQTQMYFDSPEYISCVEQSVLYL